MTVDDELGTSPPSRSPSIRTACGGDRTCGGGDARGVCGRRRQRDHDTRGDDSGSARRNHHCEEALEKVDVQCHC